MWSSADLQKELLEQAAPSLISMLRRNEVSGVFLILNNADEYRPLAPGASQQYYGLCIRDYSPDSKYTDKEDLLVVRCPSSLVEPIGCSLDTSWNAFFTFDGNTPGDYYYKPLQAAYENPGAAADDLTYFCGVHNFGGTDREMVSYSIPLLDAKGRPYAVLGFELTTDYLRSLTPNASLYSNNSGCYALVQYQEGSNSFQVLASNGVLFQRCFGSAAAFSAELTSNGMIRCTGSLTETELRGRVSDLLIYNHNTPFESERLALVGLVETESLYQISTLVERRLMFVSFWVLLLGSLALLFFCRRLTHPINRLSAKVRGMDGSTQPHLERLNIDEIDDLVESIEGLSRKIGHAAVRTEFFPA
ncbi:MAG: hypothetical protein PHD67_09465 [Oscillospiraceae bacterium]|nr:hypothetical protein [Oscillospiraceae bacterium]